MIWQNIRAAILRDLHTALSEDDAERSDQAMMPQHFEQSFGFGEGSWPAPVILLEDGREVRLHGVIDRVDINLERTRAQVIDYKTGRVEKDKPEAENLLLGGRKVQLAVYAEAVRRWAAETGEPIRDVESMYWFISAKGGFAKLSVPHTERVSAALAEVVNDIDQGVRTGAFPQAPGEFDDWWACWDNCRWCPFDRICPSGRDAAWERKREDPASRLHSRLSLNAVDPG
ncbi:MAG: PD-(D/E)XK nuclease family protein [Candidatus Dormibacteria bacterium]